MRSTGLKSALRNGSLTIGSWICWDCLPTAEIVAAAGFDWLAIDEEHTCIDFSQAMDLMMIIEKGGSAPLVRVGANDPLLIKRSMDSGAHGIVVPNVNSPEEARAAVNAMYYPPRGSRGVGLGRAQGYGVGFDEYRLWLEEEAVLIVQIEDIRAVEQIDSILAVEGVDAFFVGTYDLSASLGKPGRFEEPEVTDALRVIERTLALTTKPGGIHVVHPDVEMLKQRIREGYRFIAYSADTIIFQTTMVGVSKTIIEVRNG